MEPAWTSPNLNPYLIFQCGKQTSHGLCILLTLVWAISVRMPGSWTRLHWLCPVMEALCLGKGEGPLGHAVTFSWRRSPLEDVGESEIQGKLHRCQLYCSKNTLSFIALIFYSLLPEWRHMLGFCIHNWGRTDGRDAVGSNTIIKIIYTARNSRACARRWVEPHGLSCFISIPHGNYWQWRGGGGSCFGKM